MENYLSYLSILRIFKKWKKHLLIATVTGFVLSIIIAYTITPKYLSSAVIYPANISPFSAETKTEQMLQMLQSSYIRNKVIDKFDLYKHYEIDTTRDKYYLSNVTQEYKTNITFTKSEFESVTIDVMDKNRFLASEIANSIIDFYNEKTGSLLKDKAREMMNIYHLEMIKKEKEKDSLDNYLNHLRKRYGLLDYNAQVKEVTRNVLRKAGGSSRGADTLLRNLLSKGGDLVSATENLSKVRVTYSTLKDLYETQLREVDKKQTYTYIITNPVPADKKAYPIRWLIVLITTSSILLFSIIVVVAIESYKQFVI